jgi:hypothetical protein
MDNLEGLFYIRTTTNLKVKPMKNACMFSLVFAASFAIYFVSSNFSSSKSTPTSYLQSAWQHGSTEQRGQKDAEDESEAKKPKPMTRDEFKRAVMGENYYVVINLASKIGEPDSSQEAGKTKYLYYSGKSVDPITGKPDRLIQVVFYDGFCNGVNFY